MTNLNPIFPTEEKPSRHVFLYRGGATLFPCRKEEEVTLTRHQFTRYEQANHRTWSSAILWRFCVIHHSMSYRRG